MLSSMFMHFLCLQRVIERQNKVVITDRMWARLLSSTNQPSFLDPKAISGFKKDEETGQTQLLEWENHTEAEGRAPSDSLKA